MDMREGRVGDEGRRKRVGDDGSRGRVNHIWMWRGGEREGRIMGTKDSRDSLTPFIGALEAI